jgi:hypothetical protein
VGCPYRNAPSRRRRRPRRPRPRICLRQGCGHRYLPRRWNQRYCQDPECRRQLRRWQAARRQARRRQDQAAKTQHAQAERARRQHAASLPQPPIKPEVTPARGHAAKIFLPLPLCDRPGCYDPPLKSVRNSAHYCGPACHRAVHRVSDRERKWRSRRRFRTQRARQQEYATARARRPSPPDNTTKATSLSGRLP